MSTPNHAAGQLRAGSFPSGKRWPRVWVFVLLGIHAGLLAWAATRHSPTIDEPNHLAAGVAHWEAGRFDLNRGNPPLVGMVAASPVLVASSPIDWRQVRDNGQARYQFMKAGGPRFFWLFTLGRWACIPFSLLGGYLCFRWARELYGYGSGLVALALWCFGSNVLAYGQVIGGDMAATAVGLAAFYAFWKWLSRPSLGRAGLAGLLLGLAELTKFVWVILFLLWPLLWIVWRWSARRQAARPPWHREAGHLVLILLLSLFVINLGYCFERPFQPLERFYSGRMMLERIGALPPGSASSNPTRPTTSIGALPLPFPENYVAGIDDIWRRAVGWGGAYIHGRWRPGTNWYYYPYALAVKLPLGTLALFALAVVLSFASRRYSAGWRTELYLLVPVFAVIGFATWTTILQVLRYVLPIWPFAFIWASKAGRAFEERNRPVAVLATACLVASVASSMWTFPHSLAYFNEMAGGPRRGIDRLIDWNLDASQDLLYLKQWYDEHPEARPFHLAYYGNFDARMAGFEFSMPPTCPHELQNRSFMPQPEHGPLPGWHAVSVNLVCGFGWWFYDGTSDGTRRIQNECYACFRRFRPVDTAGYSIHIYHIDCAEANRVRSQLGMPPIPCDDAPAGR